MKPKFKHLGKRDGFKWYELREDFRYKEHIIPKGFVTNFASVPPLLQWLYPQQGKYSIPSFIHDYLYGLKDFSRMVADAIFYQAMKEYKVHIFTRVLFFTTVRLFGKENKA